MQKTGKTAAGSTTCMMTNVARWGYFNQKANTDIIKMDATGVEMLFLERSENGRYIKADIFDHPTAFPPRN